MRSNLLELTCDICLKVDTLEIINIKNLEFQIQTEGWMKKNGQDFCPRCSGNAVGLFDMGARPEKITPRYSEADREDIERRMYIDDTPKGYGSDEPVSVDKGDGPDRRLQEALVCADNISKVKRADF